MAKDRISECYAPGTIKVAWIDGQDFHLMKSEFFADMNVAKAFCRQLYTKDLHFMVMRLEFSENDFYQWRIVPFGPAYHSYKKAMFWRKRTWIGKLFS